MALMSRNLNGEIPTYVFLGFPKQIMFHGCFVRYLVFGKFMTKPFWDVLNLVFQMNIHLQPIWVYLDVHWGTKVWIEECASTVRAPLDFLTLAVWVVP